MAWFFYYFLMYVFVAGMRVMALWDRKAQLWVAGRKDWILQLKILPPKKSTRIWFHVSSLGEFEQARPVIEKLKKKANDLDIILTFFSPSGYTIRKEYPMATVFYLPADLPGNATQWLDLVRPDLAVFVKYDLWPGFLKGLQSRRIPSILISAHWTRSQTITSRTLPPTRSLLFGFKQIFLQQGEDLEYFRKKGFDNLSVAGDTRIDRSLALPDEAAARIPEKLKSFAPFDLVAGSTWPPDEKLVTEAVLRLDLSLIMAPHDVSEKNIERLMNAFPFPVVRLSAIDQCSSTPKVIIVDSIGLLAFLYALGKIAYIGGGFGTGIHNTLEPMAHGKPLIFGPAFEKFPEAVAMIREKAAMAVANEAELVRALEYFQTEENAEIAGSRALDYMVRQKGASDKVVNYILELIPFGHSG